MLRTPAEYCWDAMKRNRTKRVLVVSHPAVIAANQGVYRKLLHLNWDVRIVTPSVWRHEYTPGYFKPGVLPELADRLYPLPVIAPGHPQRHVYRALPGKLLRKLRPDIMFLEQELYSLSAYQWGRAAHRFGIPYGLQQDENLDRPLPSVARLIRTFSSKNSAFVVTRSPSASALASKWGFRGSIRLVPHAAPLWPANAHELVSHAHRSHERFTVGFAGRLVPEKGLTDLLEALRLADFPTRLLIVGDGPLRTFLQSAAMPRTIVDIRTGVGHDSMPAIYREMDVLVLPSWTTERWSEQFGRVLVEAPWCGVPVIGTASGEIPWVINATGAGWVTRERHPIHLAELLTHVHGRPEERRRRVASARPQIERLFSEEACGTELSRVLLEILGEQR